MRDVVAALAIPGLREMGFAPDAVNRIVELVQEADQAKLKRAMVVTYRSETPGMMRHGLLDVDDNEARKDIRALMLRDKTKKIEDREVISATTLDEMVRGLLKMLAERRQERALQKAGQVD